MAAGCHNRGMKLPRTALSIVVLFVSVTTAFATRTPGPARTIKDLNAIPTRVLQRAISPKFYKTLLVSPVEGWVVVRANLSGTHLSGAHVVKSELNGAYDALALERARQVTIARYYNLDRPYMTGSVLIHLLIYKTADGTLALSFAHLDEPGGDQMEYWGCTKLAVLKADGKWDYIKGPPGLEDQGLMVRKPGLLNNAQAVLKMENIPGAR
jgi:hypothetical protein